MFGLELLLTVAFVHLVAQAYSITIRSIISLLTDTWRAMLQAEAWHCSVLHVAILPQRMPRSDQQRLGFGQSRASGPAYCTDGGYHSQAPKAPPH